jgi:hypothetical protein
VAMVMAQVDVMIGNYDDAIDELEQLLTIQSWWTATYMRADPLFAPLGKIQRFNAMLDEFEKANGV